MASTNVSDFSYSQLERLVRLNVELEQRVTRRENLIQDLDYKILKMTDMEKVHLKEIQEANAKIAQLTNDLTNERNGSQITSAVINELANATINELGEKEKKIKELVDSDAKRPTTTPQTIDTPLTTAFSHLVIMFVIIGFLQSLLS